MKPYSEYKDTGVEWIGKIPQHWDVIKLKYSDQVIMGQSPSSDDYKAQIGLPFLQGNADFTSIFPNPRVYCDTANKIAEKNDVLLSVRAPIGAVNISDQKYGIGRGLCAIRSNMNIPRLMFYFALSIYAELNKLGTGSTYMAVTVDNVKNITIPKINIEDQKQIAKYLDHKTAQIDSLIEKKKRLIEFLREERTAVINQAVTKGLDPNVPMKDSGIEWLGEIPAHWEVKRLKYLAEVVLGKMLTPEDKGGYNLKPYLRAKNLTWLKVDAEDIKEMWFSDAELKQYRLVKNDLLVSEGGEVGRTCIWNDEIPECYIQNSVNRVRFFKNLLPKYFLYLFLIYGYKGHFDAVVSRVSIAHLTKEKLVDISFIAPTLNEQENIVYTIENEITRIDTIISKSEKEITLLQEYRTALISEVVTGKIDVREERI